MSIAEVKQEIRQTYKQRRRNVSAGQYRSASLATCRSATSCISDLRNQLGRPLYIFGYLPFGKELDIKPLLYTCRKRGDYIYIPRVETTHYNMTLHRWMDETQYTTESFGLQEPILETEQLSPIDWWRLDVMIIPGIAFDRQGGRIGLGVGCYDRFWHKFVHTREGASVSGHAGNSVIPSPLPLRISCLYAWQVIERIPMEPHDIRVDCLCAEEQLIFCK